MAPFNWGRSKKERSKSTASINSPHGTEDEQHARRLASAKFTADGFPSANRNLGRHAPNNFVDSDDSETDDFGMVHKRKKSEPIHLGHTRAPSYEAKQRSSQCPTCNEACPIDESSDLVQCPTCDTKMFPTSHESLDKRPLPPVPVQQPMSLKEFENMMADVFRQYGRIIFRQEAGIQGLPRSPLPGPSTSNYLQLPETPNGRARAGSDSSGMPMVLGHHQSPPRLRTPNSHQQMDNMPIRHNTMLRSARPPNLDFRDRAASSHGPSPTNPSPQVTRTPRTPLSDMPWRRHVERELEQAKFGPAQIERLIEAKSMSFCSTRRPVVASRSKSENAPESPRLEKPTHEKPREPPTNQQPLPPLPLTPDHMYRDHKALMVGEVYDVVRPLADNGDQTVRSRPSQSQRDRRSASAYTDWDALRQWYNAILHYFLDVESCLKLVCDGHQNAQQAGPLRDEVRWIGLDMMKALLEMIDFLVTAPRHTPINANDLRYLVVLLVNPILGPKQSNLAEVEYRRRDKMRTMNSSLYQAKHGTDRPIGTQEAKDWRKDVESPKQRIMGLLLGRLANAPRQHQQALIHWFAEVPGRDFRDLVESLKRFIGERLRLLKPRSKDERDALRTQRHLFAGMKLPNMPPPNSSVPRYSKSRSMWALRAACSVLEMLFTANDKHVDKPEWWERVGEKTIRHPAVRRRLLPVDEFSFSLLDPSASRIDVEEDFEAWETRAASFTFCQYRFMLTLGTKVKIMELYCNRRRREMAQQDWFNSARMDRDGYFRMNVRRDCVADDSLKQLRQAIGSGSGETMKKLRVKFEDEMAIDGGGPAKEWFLSLAQDLFHGDHGLFFFNPDSQYCYFNAHYYDSTEIYELVGALFGLAVYNQTSLYAPFPPFLFKKLAAAAPIYSPKLSSEPSTWRNSWRPSIDDLAQLDPDRATFLRNLLNEQDDFEMFWEYPLFKYDIVEVTPIVPGGSDKLVTKENREDYVQAAVQFAIDTSIEKQFTAFARGFYLLCGGPALSLFRGEELELLLRGSEDFDVDTLRAAATYDGWDDLVTEEEVCEEFPIVGYFWDFFASSSLATKQKILRFITGTDRLPPAGVANLAVRITRLHVDCVHLPQARTCFSQLELPDYAVGRKQFEALFLKALEHGSDSFGRK
ncbi:hypothetical protein BLS_008301 [Venturia inaequalis]|uniref:HECT-type E3 ubiquitin transferase n=1 Tax=Venturia inaequalis TaxID=5025 RepID=A0A8H3VH33_VENIN|nr:hypothetical protein BLS_008301 [Venturia inaequalis]KAE9988336.1 hypothetical protein EG327_003405 [Venturia inaequalis]